jgi:hypothetical protein
MPAPASVAADTTARLRPAAHRGRLLADYQAGLAGRGRGNRCYHEAAARFLARWPRPQAFADQPLHVMLAADSATRPFITFLLLHDLLRPGYDYLVARKFAALVDLARGTRLEPDLTGFGQAAAGLGFSTLMQSRAAERVLARLTQALHDSPNRLFADALLLARATGLRVGELVTLELDCVHEIPAQGAWLKVPLGKLDTERMVPLDDDALSIVDRIAVTRSPGRPLPHPKTARPTEFLLTHHGKRVSTQALRDELACACHTAGLTRITPHQLRHTWATALINAGCSLQALMHLLGHTSAAMSLRYAKLFDTTLRADYEQALAQAKAQYGPLPSPTLPGRALPILDFTGGGDWKDTPLVKARLAGGYCLRTAAQGACSYANICEHCPNFRTDTAFRTVLAAQRADTEILAADAEARGWGEEAARHRRLLSRLDAHMAQTQPS